MQFILKIRDALVAALRDVYQEKFRREWQSGGEPPHFFDQQQAWFLIGFTDQGVGPYAVWRGFLAAGAVAEGDTVLDIGCGDGFYTARFLAHRAAQAHGVDCDESAIAAARRGHAAQNAQYFLMDAVNEPFPASAYDVVVWNGSIGHFSPEGACAVLEKIVASLGPAGLFVGSEALGDEDGEDHQLRFETECDLAAMLQRYFRHVEIRTEAYRISNGAMRREAYWRCSQTRERLDGLGFARFTAP